MTDIAHPFPRPEPADLDVPALRAEVGAALARLIEFWRARAVDDVHGGYRTSFDAAGDPVPETEKYLLSHTRLVWTFATLAEHTGEESLLDLATHGVRYLEHHFHDPEHGGWFWKVHNDGSVLDDAKIVYGQSFAIYALATYARVAGDGRALAAASGGFDLFQRHAADVAHGGYYENFTREWHLAPGGPGGGDRKSLDIHLHLLEAFTELARASGAHVHRRRLAEVRAVILGAMIDPGTGAGRDQFSLDLHPVAPIVIDRTWIAERLGERAGTLTRLPGERTSYGHNLELGWLLVRAGLELGDLAGRDLEVVGALAGHALAHGYDDVRGGVFREGPLTGPADDRDKEFWQNAEALVGWLEAYRCTGQARFLEAFAGTWEFAARHLLHPAGEWRIRTREDGQVLDGSLGNHWTGAYHTARALVETVDRLDELGGEAVSPARG